MDKTQNRLALGTDAATLVRIIVGPTRQRRTLYKSCIPMGGRARYCIWCKMGCVPCQAYSQATSRFLQRVISMTRKRQKLDAATIQDVLRRLSAGEYQHDIAADLGVNQGRISEVNTGKRRSSGQMNLF